MSCNVILKATYENSDADEKLYSLMTKNRSRRRKNKRRKRLWFGEKNESFVRDIAT